MYSRLPSNEQAVKAWFRDYLSGLSSVGIKLGLTPTQKSELENRLLAACRHVDGAGGTKERVGRISVDGRRPDPIKTRWLDDHVGVQGDIWICR